MMHVQVKAADRVEPIDMEARVIQTSCTDRQAAIE
jgi:hypothetical protein